MMGLTSWMSVVLDFLGISATQLIIYLGIVFVICIILLAVFISITNSPYPQLIRDDAEKCFLDPASDEVHVFPSLFDPPGVELSVIVPAYEEEKRLPIMLDECLDYLDGRCKSEETFSFEVIVVDDGSSDKTTEIGRKYSKKLGIEKVRVLTLLENRGKGCAVTMGMMSSRGKYLLFADADGATKFSELEKLEQEMVKLTIEDEVSSLDSGWERPAIAFGSRAHLERQSIARRSLIRTFLMYGFHLVVWAFGVRGVKDTQCGFKLFTRQAARLCFTNLHVNRWAFDVELFRIANYFQMKTAEVAVQWTEIDGSKLIPVWSWLQMAKDLFLIWFRYRIGAWKISPKID